MAYSCQAMMGAPEALRVCGDRANFRAEHQGRSVYVCGHHYVHPPIQCLGDTVDTPPPVDADSPWIQRAAERKRLLAEFVTTHERRPTPAELAAIGKLAGQIVLRRKNKATRKDTRTHRKKKRQTRRSVSVRGLLYQRLAKVCEARGAAVAAFVEALIVAELDSLGAPMETVLERVYHANEGEPISGVVTL